MIPVARENQKSNPKRETFFLIIGTILVLVAALARIIPHPVNFTPILAMGLFAGRIFKSRFGLLIPTLSMLMSDLYLGVSMVSWSVYTSLLVIYFLGHGFLRNNPRGVKKPIYAVVSSSLLFFVITNFAVWLSAGLYPQNLKGLMDCYIAALPFFRNTLFSTGVYFAILIGLEQLCAKWAGQGESQFNSMPG